MDLIHVLEGQDSGYWRIVARAWKIPQILNSRDQLPDLVRTMLDPARVEAEYRELLPQDRAGIDRLRALGGKMTLARFSTEFGEIREMGIARRDRDQPWLDPVSAAERLWYQGWLGRTFWDSSNGPEEFIFIPDDLLRLIPFPETATLSGLPVESYIPRRGEREVRAGQASIWDACTLLAFLRNFPPHPAEETSHWPNRHILDRHLQLPEAVDLLLAILVEQGRVTGDPLQPVSARCRSFLEMEPDLALEEILLGWKTSRSWNDLAHVAGIQLGAKAWPNDALRTRGNFLEILQDLPQGEWLLIDSLVRAVQVQRPDFQRPLTAFSSWYLLDRSTGEELAGSDNWLQVEGALIRYYVEGPLHWLGAVDLLPSESPKAFRLNASSASLWGPKAGETTAAQTLKKKGKGLRARIHPEGTILFPARGSALRRYQLSRCTSWVARRGGDYVYRVTPNALQRAREQGIEENHVVGLLNRLAEGAVPPRLVQAIRRWARGGGEASIRSLRVLDLSKLESGTLIWDLPGVKDCLGETLGPRTWVVRGDRLPQLRTALLEQGILVELEDEE